jgi:hypothetical protein
MWKRYRYVGPAEIAVRVAGRPAGARIGSAADLLAWLRRADAEHGLVAATFVVDEQGDLLVADRRSEHVACAGGGQALSAGEMFFQVRGVGVEVVEASNQSTGFCPEPSSWLAVAEALDKIGVPHPGRFTTEIHFRRCEKCGERNVVRDGWFFCGICEAALPAAWNFG